MSARQAALKRWTATDKRWNRKVVSRGSVVTSVERLPYAVCCIRLSKCQNTYLFIYLLT